MPFRVIVLKLIFFNINLETIASIEESILNQISSHELYLSKKVLSSLIDFLS